MTVLEALQIVQVLQPLILQAIQNGQTTISQADIEAAATALASDMTALQTLIDAKKAEGK